MRDVLLICSDVVEASKVNNYVERQNSIKKLLGELLAANTTIRNKSDKGLSKIDDSVVKSKKFLDQVKSELSNDPNKEWCIQVIDHSINLMTNQDKLISDLISQLVEINELCNKMIGVSTSIKS